MKKARVILLALMGVGQAVISASAAITLTFDSANSNVGNGLYAFDLAGVATSPVPTFNSEFQFFQVFTIGNSVNPIQVIKSPSGWSLSGPNDINTAQWFFQNTSGDVNGLFEFRASPNLHGTISWRYLDPAHQSITSTISIPFAVVPEPTIFGIAGGVVLCLLAARARPVVHRRLGQTCLTITETNY